MWKGNKRRHQDNPIELSRTSNNTKRTHIKVCKKRNMDLSRPKDLPHPFMTTQLCKKTDKTTNITSVTTLKEDQTHPIRLYNNLLLDYQPLRPIFNIPVLSDTKYIIPIYMKQILKERTMTITAQQR